MRLPAIALIALLAVLLAGCGDDNGGGGDGDPGGKRAKLPLDYQRAYGGFAGGTGRLRIEPDGRATLQNGPPGEGCRRGERRFELPEAQLDRVRLLLGRAADARPRVREEPATEAPTIHIRAPGIELRYLGFSEEPELVHALVEELDDLVTDNCVRDEPSTPGAP